MLPRKRVSTKNDELVGGVIDSFGIFSPQKETCISLPLSNQANQPHNLSFLIFLLAKTFLELAQVNV